MIHHYSIAVEDTAYVAEVLAELFAGVVVASAGLVEDAYVVWFGDKDGTAIELFPRGTEIVPDCTSGQASFIFNPYHTGFSATRAAISIERSREEIFSWAGDHGWRVFELSRGEFNVIELWLENRVMIELLTPDMAKHYISSAQRYINKTMA